MSIIRTNYGAYRYKREVITWTIATISYTENGERHKEIKCKIEGVSTYNMWELRNHLLKSYKRLEKPYVHSIEKCYYWEE